MLSLLSWERGLKFDGGKHGVKVCLSLLSWERGLKYHKKCLEKQFHCRSSRGSVD